MSLTFDQISAITEDKFVPKLVDNIFKSHPLLDRLKKKEELVGGGTSLIVPLNYAQATANGFYTGTETLDTTDNEVITAAQFDWKQTYGNITLSRLDELKNMGDQQKVDFVKSKIKIVEKSMSETLGTSLYNTGGTANEIQGLRMAINADETYGGIAQASNSWWQGQEDTSSTTLTLSLLQGLMGDATEGADRPDAIYTTQDIFDIYHGLLQPQERFQDSDTAKGGFRNLMFSGIPFIVDSLCPASHLFGINEDHLKLYTHRSENFRFEKFQKPVNQNVRLAKIYWMGALASDNNSRHFKFTGITG
jgi:hypothetical protein